MDREPTVYLVDDDPGVLASLRFLLESNGLFVEVFSSASAFLRDYDKIRPGCLLLDLSMPGMDGLELQSVLRERAPELPIIFVTGQGTVPNCVQALKAGAVDFLEKPLCSDILLERVRAALETGRIYRSQQDRRSQLQTRVRDLTEREREVMQLLRSGHDMKSIARKLRISFQTVAKHRARLLKKLDANNDAELVALLAEFPPDL
jgi:two-component system, LuxR family, response regulator FixJ